MESFTKNKFKEELGEPIIDEMNAYVTLLDVLNEFEEEVVEREYKNFLDLISKLQKKINKERIKIHKSNLNNLQKRLDDEKMMNRGLALEDLKLILYKTKKDASRGKDE